MSVVIVGGNDKMVRLYKSACKDFNFKPKVFTQMTGNLKDQIGTPDLMILFTNTVSHKMVTTAIQNASIGKTVIARSHSSSLTSLKNILKTYCEDGLK